MEHCDVALIPTRTESLCDVHYYFWFSNFSLVLLKMLEWIDELFPQSPQVSLAAKHAYTRASCSVAS
jgi:hypothetical protein